MRTLRRESLVLLLGSTLVAGCAVNVPMNAKAPALARAEVQLPLRVALLLDADAQASDTPVRPGPGNFVYPVGEALEKTAPTTLAPLFAGVEKVRTLHPFPAGFDVGVHIIVDEAFLVRMHSDTFSTSTILLKCLVYDRRGEIVTTLHSRGYARGIPETKFPVFIGQARNLGRVADQALERALGALRAKLIEDEEIKRLSRK